jgi:hypothetical protein
MKLAACAAVVAGAALVAPAAFAQSSGEAIKIGGRVRTIGGILWTRGTGVPDSAEQGGFDQTLFRATLEGEPAERLTVETHVVLSYTYASLSSAAGPAGASPGAVGLSVGDTHYRALDATADWLLDRGQAASLWLDRLNIRLALPRADVTIGRQAISFGKAYFWNPLDEFLPFDARQFDRDYKAGVDAARVDVPLGPFSGINIVAAAGRELDFFGRFRGGHEAVDASWYGSALLGRYFTTLRGWDAAVQGGKVYGGYQFGGGLVGEIGSLEVRGEAAYRWARPVLPLPPPLSGALFANHLSTVAGIGRRFQNTLWIQIEHLYNGAGSSGGLDAALVRFSTGAALQLGRNLTGVAASYQFAPLVTGQATVLHSWSDGSHLVQPTLTYSLTDNSELLAGGTVGFGRTPLASGSTAGLRTEFGSFPRAVFGELKIYF